MMNPTPEQVHILEQKWMIASDLFDKALSHLVSDIPVIKDMTGLSDASILYDYVHAYFKVQRETDISNVIMTEIMCAAAFTKLALRGQEINMTEFEEGIANNEC